MMLKQTAANLPAIQAMRDGLAGELRTPYYWVNVGVNKYFTTDITEAHVFHEECGDSLYRAELGGFGTQIDSFQDGPQAYSVEIEYVAKEGIDDSLLPENFTSGQMDQCEAERVMNNALHPRTHDVANGSEFMDNVGQVIVRLVRNGCAGSVECHKVNWQEITAAYGIIAAS